MSPAQLLPDGAAVLLYLDPSSGSLLLQMIVAGVAGAAVALRLWGRRLLTFFRRGDDGDE